MNAFLLYRFALYLRHIIQAANEAKSDIYQFEKGIIAERAFTKFLTIIAVSIPQQKYKISIHTRVLSVSQNVKHRVSFRGM